MYAEERQREILHRARTQGRVDVSPLAEEFEVTPETIRRDLDVLARRNLVRRTHGGALPVDRLAFEPTVSIREALLTAEKDAIARAALAELPDDGAVIIDAGTTTVRLAQLVPDDRELTVVTNSLPVAGALVGKANLTLHLLGGRVRGRTLAVVDDWAEKALAEIFVDVAFLGTNGLSVGHGLTTPDRGEAAVKRAMMRAARRSVVLADHTKIGNDVFARFGDVADLDVLVTDAGLDAESTSEIEAEGVRVVRA